MTDLIAPSGGVLVDLLVAQDDRPALLSHARRFPSLTLSDRTLNDLELLATGAFSPRTTFLGKSDYERVLDAVRLAGPCGADVGMERHLSESLGFSREDRDTNIGRIGFVASEIVQHGGVALCAAISPCSLTRAKCRSLVKDENFIEIFVDTPMEVCQARDTKGMSAQAPEGKLKGFTGVDDLYEPTEQPEVRLTTTDTTAPENADVIVDELLGKESLSV